MIRVFGKPDGKSEFEEADTPKTAYPARRKIIFSPRSRARIRYATVCFSRAQSEDERASHMETVKSAKRLDEGISVLRVPLTQLKLKDLEKWSIGSANIGYTKD